MPGSSGHNTDNLTANHSGATCFHVPCTLKNPAVVFCGSMNLCAPPQEAELLDPIYLSLFRLGIKIWRPYVPCVPSHFYVTWPKASWAIAITWHPSPSSSLTIFQNSSLTLFDQLKPNLVWMFLGVCYIEHMRGFLFHRKTWPPLLKIEHRSQTVVFRIYLQNR